ncbi:hypothetical protein AAVH_27670, partial [Aphelenchoides avenae]
AKLLASGRTPKNSLLTLVPRKEGSEQLLARREQLYGIDKPHEKENASVDRERAELDKLKAELDTRKKMLDKEATSIEQTKYALDAERAELQLKRSCIEAERINFDHQLESLKEEQRANRLLQMERTLRLHKELDDLKAENERLKLLSGQQPATNRRRSLPLDDTEKQFAEKQSRLSY